MTQTKKRGGLTKVATGIHGFDDITGGGLPQGRITLAMGGPGTGKTVFALQSLVAGVLQGEPGILVSFQESPRQLVEEAASFGWDLTELERDKLVILDARIRPNTLRSLELYLTGMLAGIKLVAGEMGARRVVFDSLDTLLSLLGDRTLERHEMFRIRDWLLENGFTSVITAQGEGDEPFISQRHGFMQFMSDCVVNFRNHSGSRSLRIMKYRGSGFVEDERAIHIGPGGLEVGVVRNPADHSVRKPKLKEEIRRERESLVSRLKSLNQQVEIKKAELDFLAKFDSRAGTSGRIRHPRAKLKARSKSAPRRIGAEPISGTLAAKKS